MTNEEFQVNWQNYAVEINDEAIPLKDRYCLCWGWVEQYQGLFFDTGGEQGAEANFLRVDEEDNLISVNPEDITETCVLGKLVNIGEGSRFA